MEIKEMNEKKMQTLDDDALENVSGGIKMVQGPKSGLIDNLAGTAASQTWICSCGNSNFGGQQCEYCGASR